MSRCTRPEIRRKRYSGYYRTTRSRSSILACVRDIGLRKDASNNNLDIQPLTHRGFD